MAFLNPQGMAAIKEQNPTLYRVLKEMVDSGNNVAQQVNADPTAAIPAPQPHAAISVKGGAGLFDISLTDNSPQYRGKSNFVEYSPDKAFPTSSTHVIDMGASRNHRAYLGNQTLNFRSYAAHDTSERSPITYHSGPVSGAGDTEPEMQPGQGSGTSRDAGAGFGLPYNTVQPPKRG